MVARRRLAGAAGAGPAGAERRGGGLRDAVLISVTVLALTGCAPGPDRLVRVLEGSPPPTPTSTPSPRPSPLAPRGDIRLRSPRAGDDVVSPVLVRGIAATEGGRVLVRVVDAAGTELAAMEVAIACGVGCRGRFEARLAFYVPAPTEGVVQALEVAPDGSVAQLAEVPVRLVPGA